MSHSAPETGPSVSLLLPNRNNERVLELVLERLAANTTYDQVEVVAVDDGSTDSSREILRRWRDSQSFRSFQLLEREHGGAIEALNAGLRAASGEVVVQLDADASIDTAGWLEKMLALLLADDRVGVVTAKVVLDSGSIHACGVNLVDPQGLHDRPSRITERVGHRVWHQRVDRPAEGTTQEESRIAEVDAGIGCCMMYRRSDALAVGGYDRGFSPVWFDDLDLCMAIRQSGKKVFFSPSVRVLHMVEARAEDASAPPGPREWALDRSRRVASRLGSISPAARAALARRMGLNEPPPHHRERLLHHYAYWREKWGWDLLNPDMDEVRRRHGGTEVCWALDPKRRAAGEALAKQLELVDA